MQPASPLAGPETTADTAGAAAARAPRATAALLCALLLSACATSEPPSGTRPHKRPAPVKAAPAAVPAPAPVPAQPAVQPGAAADRAGPASPDPRQQPEPPAGGAAAEWAQLARYQKAPFQVFTLTETQGLFKPAPGAVGVYAQAADVNGPIRLRLAPRPDSPVRLATGTYTVQLQLAFEYTERRACKVSSCNGEIEESVRKTSKHLRLTLSPRSGHAAQATLPLTLLNSAAPDRGYDVSYTGMVVKVRRFGIAPARR